ncbi:MAG: efflux RND transporter periplasmic adaptor subunit [Pseudomonadota bacterium]
MKKLPLSRRSIAMVLVIVPLVALLAYVALRSGPLAPVPVVLAQVRAVGITPALYGVGTVEARNTYKIGPAAAGRLRHLDVDVGQRVKAGQTLGAMDGVDLDERLRAQQAAVQRTQAQVKEAQARLRHALQQARRYEQLLAVHATSEEAAASKQQELELAQAALSAAGEELARAHAEADGLRAQRANLRLVAPVDGIVTARLAEPGTTVVAGQSVLEVIDPERLWISVRFDQIGAAGLTAGLPARMVLRSRAGQPLAGRVLRVEPRADAVTEELLAKVVFDQQPVPLPPLGELVEVTVSLPALRAMPAVPNTAIQHVDGRIGVWKVAGDDLLFTPIRTGAHDLDGRVQVHQGLNAGERVVAYSQQALKPGSRIQILDQLPERAR